MNLTTRRGVLAHFALAAVAMPRRITFPDGDQGDGLLSIEFDSLADMAVCITDVFGIDDGRVRTQPYDHGDIRGTLGTATNLTWQGWSLYLSAMDRTDPDASLDEDTQQRLEAVVADESEHPDGTS